MISDDELTLQHVANLTPSKAQNLLQRVDARLDSMPVPKRKRGRRRMATEILPAMLEADEETMFYMKLVMARNDLLERLKGK